jgi:hypothetical protein
MNPAKLVLGFLIVTATILLGCNKDEVDPVENNDNDGYITFYTKNAEGCGDIPLLLNGKSIGTLVGSTASDPACQAPNGAGIITIGVNIGAHDYSASDNCNNIWTGTIIINKGDCKTKELSR